MISPRPWQVGQVRSIAKKPCCARTRPMAGAGGAGLWLGALFGARSGAGLAGRRGRELQRRRLAVIGLLERDLHIVAQIRAALAAVARAAAAPPHDVAEEILENIGHGGAEALAAEAEAAALFEGGMAKTVVGGALLRVAQALIGFVQFLETRFRRLVAGMSVGMALHRRLAEGDLHLDFGRGPA